jgi:ABC-type multidrug transport system ATPase subunit
MRGRTTFVIAHRLSTIRRAEQILVVEAGRIIERGTHESLYAAGGRYYDLYSKQHAVASNLFLAPGESSADGDESSSDSPANSGRGSGNNGAKDAGVPDPLRLIRGQT